MSGTYAKEFVKWLEDSSLHDDSSKATDSDDPDEYLEGDMGDEVDNPFGFGSPLDNSNKNKVNNNTAPILSDEDIGNGRFGEEDLSCKESQYNEEPPILEPVPVTTDHKQHYKQCNNNELPPGLSSAEKYKSAKICKRKVSQNDSKTKLSNDPNADVMFSNYERKECDHDMKCSKSSGNIFDKFNAISEKCDPCDDMPPPLIPSPAAMPQDSPNTTDDSETVSQKFSNASPDFRAMEADSTSEIAKCTVTENRQERCSKIVPKSHSSGDVSIECDSTCMLGVSPNPNAPSSGLPSPMDVDDSGNQSDNQATTHKELATVRENDDSGADEILPLRHTIQEEVSVATNMEETTDVENNKSNSWFQECPTLQAVKEEDPMVSDHCLDNVDAEEPPVLSMSLPESNQSVRKKRHTVDTMENIDDILNRKYNLSSSLEPDDKNSRDLSVPPNLLNEAQIEVPSVKNQINKHKHSIRKSVSGNSNKTPYTKYKGRPRSYSVVDYSKFIKRASELSMLQSKMYKLVSLLFPQVKSQLDAMSPESSHFETMLVDIISALNESMPGSHEDVNSSEYEEADLNGQIDIAGPSKTNLCVNTQSPGPETLSGPVDDSNSSVNSQLSSADICSPNDNHNTAINNNSLLPNVNESSSKSNNDIAHVRHSPPLLSSSDVTMIPQLSQLSLSSSTEQILKRQPSVVIKTNVMESMQIFSRLACNVLQLLLPDITLNLFDTVGGSYRDLLNLVDSLILLNSD